MNGFGIFCPGTAGILQNPDGQGESLSLSVPPASVEHGVQDKGFEKSSQMEFVL